MRRNQPPTPPRPLTVEERKERWLYAHGVTVEEYEARKGDAEWIALIKRRGKVQ